MIGYRWKKERPRDAPGPLPHLGCYPLSGAIESDAASIADIVAEMETARVSERQGRLIDTDEAASMEKKKREGYF